MLSPEAALTVTLPLELLTTVIVIFFGALPGAVFICGRLIVSPGHHTRKQVSKVALIVVSVVGESPGTLKVMVSPEAPPAGPGGP